MIINGKEYKSMDIGSDEYKAWNKQASDAAFAEEVEAGMDEYAVFHDEEFMPRAKPSNAPLRKDVEILSVNVFYDIEVSYKVAGAEDFMLLDSNELLAEQGGPASKAARQLLRRWPHDKIIDLIVGHEEDEAPAPSDLEADIYLAALEDKIIHIPAPHPDPVVQAAYLRELSVLCANVEQAPDKSKQQHDAQEALLKTLRAGPQNKE